MLVLFDLLYYISQVDDERVNFFGKKNIYVFSFALIMWNCILSCVQYLYTVQYFIDLNLVSTR